MSNLRGSISVMSMDACGVYVIDDINLCLDI